MTPSFPIRGSAAALLFAATLAAPGCTFLNEQFADANRIDYKSAGKAPPLDIPPDLTQIRGDERFAIPERGDRTASGFERQRAAGSAAAGASPAGSTRVLPAVEGARIERAGGQRWLSVQLPPDRVWPVLREFWQENGFIVQSESPQTGVLETDWAENRAKIPQDIIRRTIGTVFDALYSTGERDRFRTRIEAAPGGGTDVFISHRGMIEVYTSQIQDQTRWQPRPNDPELEAEFLRRLMVKLGVEDQRARALVASAAPSAAAAAGSSAAAPVASEFVRLVRGSDGARVDVAEPFDRAWRRVWLALDRGGFTVEDRDRTRGLYYVRYIDPEVEARRTAAQPGMIGRLLSFGRGSTNLPAQQYQVSVRADGSTTRVGVLGKDGSAPSAEERPAVERILSLLVEQLRQ